MRRLSLCQIEKLWQGYLWLHCCCQRTEDLQYSCQNVSHITWKHSSTVVHVVCSLLVWRFVMISVFHFHLCFFLFLFCFFLSFLFFFLLVLSLVVYENREEPWSWFQYLWWHQRPGEPLQTLRHGTTRTRPASQSQPPRLYLRVAMETAARYRSRSSLCPYVCLSPGQQLTWLTLSVWSHTTDCWKNGGLWFEGEKKPEVWYST